VTTFLLKSSFCHNYSRRFMEKQAGHSNIRREYNDRMKRSGGPKDAVLFGCKKKPAATGESLLRRRISLFSLRDVAQFILIPNMNSSSRRIFFRPALSPSAHRRRKVRPWLLRLAPAPRRAERSRRGRKATWFGAVCRDKPTSRDEKISRRFGRINILHSYYPKHH
jgi:hypothetical protein